MGSEVNITSQERLYLLAALDLDEFNEQCVTRKISEWKGELVLYIAILVKIATTQPHAFYAAFIHSYICSSHTLQGQI